MKSLGGPIGTLYGKRVCLAAHRPFRSVGIRRTRLQTSCLMGAGRSSDSASIQRIRVSGSSRFCTDGRSSSQPRDSPKRSRPLSHGSADATGPIATFLKLPTPSRAGSAVYMRSLRVKQRGVEPPRCPKACAGSVGRPGPHRAPGSVLGTRHATEAEALIMTAKTAGSCLSLSGSVCRFRAQVSFASPVATG